MKGTPGSYYTAKEAQARLGLSKSTFHKWVRQGLIPKVILPGMKQGVYPRRDIEALVLSMSAQQSTLIFSPSSPADMVEELKIASKYQPYGSTFSLAERIALQQKCRFCYYSLKLRGSVIGYSSIFSLSARTVDDLLTGRKIEADITQDLVLPFVRREPLHAYLDSIAIDPDLPKSLSHYYAGVLIYHFIDLLFRWLANDYQILELYVVARSEQDETLLRRLGFQYMQEKSLVPTRKPYQYLMNAPGIAQLQGLQERYWHHLRALL
ncbi:MAG TPA: helix-turn-helix domain-containing protein [Ktedonobacteraceae bacterium]|nr:helix-turn-helix domain-containing protein [Ktedonobacteraceae bacterium]